MDPQYSSRTMDGRNDVWLGWRKILENFKNVVQVRNLRQAYHILKTNEKMTKSTFKTNSKFWKST